jgi:hypothetical protein
MIPLNNDCLQYSGKKKDCPVIQKGKTFRIINEKGFDIQVYEVDPCLINDKNQQKCDYLLLAEKDSDRRAYFVELKGTSLTDAINQLHNSINILYKLLHEHKIFARIVGKRVTPYIKSRQAKLDEKLKRFGGNLIISSNPEYIETIREQ